MKGFMQNGFNQNFYTTNPQLNLSFQSQTQQGLRDQQDIELQENPNSEENDQNFVQNQGQYENNNYDELKQEYNNDDFQSMVQKDKADIANSNGNSSLQNHANSSNKEQEQDTQLKQSKLGKVRAVPHVINPNESPLQEQEASSTQGKSSKNGEDQVSSNNSIKNENSDSDYIQKKINNNNNYIHQVIIVQRQNTEEIQGYDKQFKDMINFKGDTHIQVNKNQQEQIFPSQQIKNGVQIQGLENINSAQYCKNNSDFSNGTSSNSSSNYTQNNHKIQNQIQNITRYNLRKKNQINYTENNPYQDEEDNNKQNNDQTGNGPSSSSQSNQQFEKFGIPQSNNQQKQQQQKQQLQQQIKQQQQQQNEQQQQNRKDQRSNSKHKNKQNGIQVHSQPKKREYSKIDYQNDQTFRELQKHRNGVIKSQSNGAMSMEDKNNNSFMRSSDRDSKRNISIESSVEMDEEYNSKKNSQKRIQYENEEEQDGYQEECEDNLEEDYEDMEEQKIDKNNIKNNSQQQQQQKQLQQQNNKEQYREDEIQSKKKNNNNSNNSSNNQLVLANNNNMQKQSSEQQKKSGNNLQMTEKQRKLMFEIYEKKKIPKYLLDNKFHIINYSNKWIDKFLHIEPIQFLLYVSKHSQMVNIFEKNNRDILLAKPSLPTREQYMQRAHQMKQNQKTSKYHNKTKLFINCLVRFFTRQNLNNLRLPTQLQETIFQFIDKVRISGVSLKQNSSVKKSDLFNNSHLRLMFLNLVDFDIEELKGKSYNNDILLHKTVFGLDLSPELEDKNEEQQQELIYYATFLKMCVYEILNLHLRQDLCVSKPEHISYNNNKQDKLSLTNLSSHEQKIPSQNTSNVSSPQMQQQLKKKDSYTNSSVYKEDESLNQKKQNEAKNNINPQQSTLSQQQLELIPDNNDNNNNQRNGFFKQQNQEEQNGYCEDRDYENKTFKLIDQLIQGKMVKRIQ